jgi:hypothetical protein
MEPGRIKQMERAGRAGIEKGPDSGDRGPGLSAETRVYGCR